MEKQNQNNTNQTDVDDAIGIDKSDKDAELDVCKKQTEEYLNNWKRERADFINYKKDDGKRMEEFVKFANGGLILELLDAMDDLYLAVKQVYPVKSKKAGTATQLFDGVKDIGLDQIIRKFESLLKKYGVEKIKIGDKFDPMYHEIVEGAKGDKIEEVRAGFTMHGRVIRPVRVKIVKN